LENNKKNWKFDFALLGVWPEGAGNSFRERGVANTP